MSVISSSGRDSVAAKPPSLAKRLSVASLFVAAGVAIVKSLQSRPEERAIHPDSLPEHLRRDIGLPPAEPRGREWWEL